MDPPIKLHQGKKNQLDLLPNRKPDSGTRQLQLYMLRWKYIETESERKAIPFDKRNVTDS